jgi:hypothetical protein
MKPSIGRIVHYRERTFDFATQKFKDGVEGPFAAIITKVYSDTCVSLQVFREATTQVECRTSVMFDESEMPSGSQTWMWPARVE